MPEHRRPRSLDPQPEGETWSPEREANVRDEYRAVERRKREALRVGRSVATNVEKQLKKGKKLSRGVVREVTKKWGALGLATIRTRGVAHDPLLTLPAKAKKTTRFVVTGPAGMQGVNAMAIPVSSVVGAPGTSKVVALKLGRRVPEIRGPYKAGLLNLAKHGLRTADKTIYNPHPLQVNPVGYITGMGVDLPAVRLEHTAAVTREMEKAVRYGRVVARLRRAARKGGGALGIIGAATALGKKE